MRKLLLAFVLASTMFAGCYTAVQVTDEPAPITVYRPGYWWGWYGWHAPNHYPRYFVTPRPMIHIPRVYERPRVQHREMGNTKHDVRTPQPPRRGEGNQPQPPRNNNQPRQPGNRR